MDSQIIIPKYRGESYGFQRAADWLFRSEGGFARHIENTKRMIRAQLPSFANDNLAERTRSVEGLGQPILQVSKEDWMYWQIALPGCWRDRQFVREYKRDNAYARMPKPAQKTFVVGGLDPN